MHREHVAGKAKLRLPCRDQESATACADAPAVVEATADDVVHGDLAASHRVLPDPPPTF